MSDEAPAIEQDKPDAAEAPDTGQVEGSEESFVDGFDINEVPADARPHVEALQKQWQSAYTQKRQAERQALADERQGIEEKALEEFAQAISQNPSLLKQLSVDEKALLEAYGYATEDPEEEFVDPTEAKLSELEQWKASIEQEAEASAQFEAEADFVEEELGKLEEGSGQKFDDEEAQWIFDMARNRPTPKGLPDVKGAVSLLDKLGKRRFEAYKESKSKVPRVPGQGKAGSKAIDPKNEEEFLNYLTEVAQEKEASQA